MNKQINTIAELIDCCFNMNTIKAVAYCINLYDNGNNNFSAEFVTTNSFSKKDDDWACDEIYASRNENIEYYFTASTWKNALEITVRECKNYLRNGQNAKQLKKAKGFACGFVEGDLIRIH